jgi:hypothetical protein
LAPTGLWSTPGKVAANAGVETPSAATETPARSALRKFVT